MDKPKEYQISTLKDIFNLPTLEVVERCMDEIKEAICAAKATEEALVFFAKEKGLDVDKALDFPEVTTWIDDNKGNVGFKIQDESTGETLIDVNLRDKGGQNG